MIIFWLCSLLSSCHLSLYTPPLPSSFFHLTITYQSLWYISISFSLFFSVFFLLFLILDMLEIMGGGQELESSLLWENNPWGGILNPENLAGGVRLEKVAEEAGEEDKKEEKKQAAAATVVLTTTGRKRGRGGGRQKSCCSGGGGAGGRRGGGGGGGGDDDQSSLDDHENHIVTERQRRKKMRTMFATLHSMLPQLPPKVDKSSIVDEAVNHIKTLEQTVQNLEKQVFEKLHGVTTINYDKNDSTRESFMADQGYSPPSNNSNSSNLTITPTNSSSNLVSMAPPMPSQAATFPVLYQTYTSPNVVLNVCGNQAQISVCFVRKPGLLTAICYVLEKYKLEVVSAHVSSDYNRSIYMIQVHAGGMFDQALEAFSVLEETYKQAAAEIMYWVASG